MCWLLLIKERILEPGQVDDSQEEHPRAEIQGKESIASELQGDDPNPKRGLRKILFNFFPKLARNKGMRAFLFYLIASRFFFMLYKRSLELRFLSDKQGKDRQLPKESLILVDTIVFPIALLTGYLSSPFIKRGSAIRRYQIAVLVDILTCIHRFYLSTVYKTGDEKDLFFFVQLLANYMFGIAEYWTFYFWFGHLNFIITDVAYSSTILAIFTSANNAADWGVTTLGLWILKKFEAKQIDIYNRFVVLFACCALVTLLLLRSYTFYLDDLPIEE